MNQQGSVQQNIVIAETSLVRRVPLDIIVCGAKLLSVMSVVLRFNKSTVKCASCLK